MARTIIRALGRVGTFQSSLQAKSNNALLRRGIVLPHKLSQLRCYSGSGGRELTIPCIRITSTTALYHLRTGRRLCCCSLLWHQRGYASQTTQAFDAGYQERQQEQARMKEYKRSERRQKKQIDKAQRAEYLREYRQRPEVKAKRREYNQRPEVKARRKEYLRFYVKRPEVKAAFAKHRRVYRAKENVKAKEKEYFAKEDVKERARERDRRRRATEEHKEYRRMYYQRNRARLNAMRMLYYYRKKAERTSLEDSGNREDSDSRG